MRVTGCGPRLTARIEATRNDIYGPACSSRACMKDKRARANKAFDSQKMTTRTAGPVQGARGPGSERGQEGGREVEGVVVVVGNGRETETEAETESETESETSRD